jgi:hypothetical protein
MIYSFNLSDYESGDFTATRFPDDSAVSGDWVCYAKSDRQALARAKRAALEEWAAPETREPQDFRVSFTGARSTSGTTQTSAQRRARGLHRIEVWLPREYVRKLDALCEEDGYTRSEHIQSWIDGETEELRQLRTSPAAEGTRGEGE